MTGAKRILDHEGKVQWCAGSASVISHCSFDRNGLDTVRAFKSFARLYRTSTVFGLCIDPPSS
jgi:hypothetical protein